MNDGPPFIIVASVCAVLVFSAYSLGRISVADDCENYGKSKVENRMIVCEVRK